MNMPDRLLNKSIRKQDISFNKNDMNIKTNSIYYGSMASYQRADFKNLGADEQLKKKSEAIANSFNVATKVSNLNFSELNSLADSVIVNYDIEVKNEVQDVAGMKIFRLPWTDVNSLNIVSAETRKYPFQYWSYQTEDKTTEIITIELPEVKKLAEVPEDL
jgi:hypothetical protein